MRGNYFERICHKAIKNDGYITVVPAVQVKTIKGDLLENEIRFLAFSLQIYGILLKFSTLSSFFLFQKQMDSVHWCLC